MIRSTAKPLLALGAAAALTLGASGTARANPLHMYDFLYTPVLEFEMSHQDLDPGTGTKGDYFTAGVGVFSVDYTTSGGQKVTEAVCNDLFKNISQGDDVTDYTEHALSELPNNAAKIGGLVHKYLDTGMITDAKQSAGFNLAIWELTYDATPDLANGVFKVNSGGLSADQQAAYNDAKGYLAEALSSTQGIWLKSPTHQDLLINHPVPEPAFYQMGALCLLGGAGIWRRRRR